MQQQQEVEYLGYLLTSDGIKLQQKKIEAIKRIKPPKNPKQLRSFLGLVNFYRDLWPKRSHILGPLSKLSSCTPKNWVWGRDQQKAFEEVKEKIQKEALLQYPDFRKPFDLFECLQRMVIFQEYQLLPFYQLPFSKVSLTYGEHYRILHNEVTTFHFGQYWGFSDKN